MERRRLYIGIDLGDKTTSMFYANSGSSDMANCIQLPGTIGNAPLETTVCILKNGKRILSNEIEYYQLSELDRIYHNFKYQPDAVKFMDTSLYRIMREGVRKFLDCVFESETFQNVMEPLLADKDEVVFCIGYPTNWSDESVREYQEMIRESCLGKYEEAGSCFGVPVRICFERESTGAYVYINGNSIEFQVKDKGNILVVDFGSSTVNITALGRDSRKALYSSGNNQFGGRQLDAVIAADCFSSLSREKKKFLKELDHLNKGAATKMLILAANQIKEELSGKEKCRKYISCIEAELRYDKKKLYHIAMYTPMKVAAHIMPGLIEINENRSWAEAMEHYLRSEREKLRQNGIYPEMIILTGGGASMPLAQEICREVFGVVQTLNASESSTIIARGLALAAKNQEKADEFCTAVDDFVQNSLPNRINAEMSALIRRISDEITESLCEGLKQMLLKWQNGSIDTFHDVISRIRGMDANDIVSRQEIQNSIQGWYREKIYDRLNKELNNICEQYGIREFKLPKRIEIRLSSIHIASDEIVNQVAGVMVGTIVTLITIIIGILALSGIGLPILAVAAGVAVLVLIIKGWKGMKDSIVDGLKGMSIPGVARAMVSESEIDEAIKENAEQIKNAVQSSIQGNQASLKKSLSEAIGKQIQEKVVEIRYELR